MGLEVIMQETFALSYGLLCALLVVQAIVLRHALKRAAKLSRLYSEAHKRQKRETSANPTWRVSPGTRLPDFAASLLGTDRTLTRSDLEGRETILLFVSPADAFSPARHQMYHRMVPAVRTMWDTVDGEVYLVCKGSREACHRLTDGSGARAILDEDGQLFSSLQIDRTPRAIQLDEKARVIRYGEPDETRRDALDDKASNGFDDRDDGAAAHTARNGHEHR